MTKNEHTVRIQENYKNYTPPVPAKKIVEMLLEYVPSVHLIKLKDIVLTNSEAMSRERKRKKTWTKKRKVSLKHCNGLYHQEWEGKTAWIELFLDHIYAETPWILIKTTIYRDYALSKTLYHEIGHHIHKTQIRKYGEPEDVADEWQKRFCGEFIRKKYWYWRFFPLSLILKVFLIYAQRMMAEAEGDE